MFLGTDLPRKRANESILSQDLHRYQGYEPMPSISLSLSGFNCRHGNFPAFVFSRRWPRYLCRFDLREKWPHTHTFPALWTLQVRDSQCITVRIHLKPYPRTSIQVDHPSYLYQSLSPRDGVALQTTPLRFGGTRCRYAQSRSAESGTGSLGVG